MDLPLQMDLVYKDVLKKKWLIPKRIQMKVIKMKKWDLNMNVTTNA